MADENGSGVPKAGSTVESILQVLMGQLSHISKAETVTGTPITADKTTIIPVSRVAIGFAAGGSDAGGEVGSESSRRAKVSIGGTGGGITVEPIAFIVVDPTGKPSLLPVKGPGSSIARVIDLIPEALQKIAALKPGNALAADGGAPEKAHKELTSGEKKKS